MRFTLNQSVSRLQRLYVTGLVSFGLITIFASCGGSNGGDGYANNAPTATITSPADGGVYVYGDTITFTGTGNDAEDGPLNEDSLVWISDIDGEIGTGSSFTRDDLLPGDHTITLTATDSKGTTGSIFIMISVNIAPTATITSPADGCVYVYGDTITFTGTGNDAEAGPLNEDSLVWTSDIDGEIGTGSYFTRDDLSPGDHTITLTATDNKGTPGSNMVIITVKGWRHPASLTDNISPDGELACDPDVAMDNSGNAIIVWYQHDGSYFQVFKSEYRNGAWTHPSGLDDNISPDGQDVHVYPQVAMDNSGNAIITWMQRNDAGVYQIFMSEYRNGAWTHPASLSDHISPDEQSAQFPQVAMDHSGNAIITWAQTDNEGNGQIFKSEYRNGAWSHPASLDDNISPDGQNAGSPQVAMDNSGNAIITWSQSDDNLYHQIFKSEYQNGNWSHPSSLTDNISFDEEDAWNPQVAMDNSGNAIITWLQLWELAQSGIFKSEYRNGAWVHPASLDDHISPDGATDPQVAMDNNGNAIITWMGSDGINDQIFMSEYRNGAWAYPASLDDHISPDGQDAGWYPQVAMDNSGNAIITWMQIDGSRYQIFKSEYRNGVWTHPSDLADNISPDGQNASYPQVAMDNNDHAVITWIQYNGSDLQIFKSEYR